MIQRSKEPEVGQVYDESRYDQETELQIVFVDKQVVLFRDSEDHHRLVPRSDFDKGVESERYNLVGEKEVKTTREDWTEVSMIGISTSKNLHAAGYHTKHDILTAPDQEIKEIGGIGSKNFSTLSLN